MLAICKHLSTLRFPPRLRNRRTAYIGRHDEVALRPDTFCPLALCDQFVLGAHILQDTNGARRGICLQVMHPHAWFGLRGYSRFSEPLHMFADYRLQTTFSPYDETSLRLFCARSAHYSTCIGARRAHEIACHTRVLVLVRAPDNL